jgi:hypothetical protein
VGVRGSDANVQSTPCVIRDELSAADRGEYRKLLELLPQPSDTV